MIHTLKYTPTERSTSLAKIVLINSILKITLVWRNDGGFKVWAIVGYLSQYNSTPSGLHVHVHNTCTCTCILHVHNLKHLKVCYCEYLCIILLSIWEFRVVVLSDTFAHNFLVRNTHTMETSTWLHAITKFLTIATITQHKTWNFIHSMILLLCVLWQRPFNYINR
jgi:hypothetical protein